MHLHYSKLRINVQDIRPQIEMENGNVQEDVTMKQNYNICMHNQHNYIYILQYKICSEET